MLDKSLRLVKEVVCQPIAIVAAKFVTPTQVTLIGFVLGMICPIFLVQGHFLVGNIFWLLNRLMDGIDGTIARISNSQTDFGGYLDILCDFIIYSIIPISLVIPQPSEGMYILLAFLEASFFVNAASLMFLAAILEKRSAGASSSGEMTTITMPTGLIEGTETLILITLAISFPSYLFEIYLVFALGVLFNIVYRLQWAYSHL